MFMEGQLSDLYLGKKDTELFKHISIVCLFILSSRMSSSKRKLCLAHVHLPVADIIPGI